jgi:hypothetical protein
MDEKERIIAEDELEKLKREAFLLEMKDTWSSVDYRYSEDLSRRIHDLKERLKE